MPKAPPSRGGMGERARIHFSNGPVRFARSQRKHVRNARTAQSTVMPLSMWQNTACGAIARATQIMSMYPVDTIKTRVQVMHANASTTSRLRMALAKRTFYRGVPMSLLGQIPYGMLTFGAYETLRTRLQQRFPNMPRIVHIVVAASIGDTLGSLWLTPSEVVKSKTQAGVYPGALAATAAVARHSGIHGFYQGYLAALARDVPFRAIQLTLYESVRSWYIRHARSRNPSYKISPPENLLLGAITGTVTAAFTTPLDVIRTRMMSQSATSPAFKNALDCAFKTVTTEGPRALYRGLAPRCLLIGPSSAIFFVAYESAKAFFRQRNARNFRACKLPTRFRNA